MNPHEPQRLVGCGYRAQVARHLVLKIRPPGASLTAEVLQAVRRLSGPNGPLCRQASALEPVQRLEAGDCAIDLGFTLAGLRRLGVPAEWLERAAGRSEAFRQGAAARAARVGDNGPSAPDRWEDWATGGRADLVIHLHADSAATLQTWQGRIEGLAGFGGAFELVAALDAARLPPPGNLQDRAAVGTEHFGYRDGIARPVFFDRRSPAGGLGRHPDKVALGELLLGHLNDVGANPWDFRDLAHQDHSPVPLASPNQLPEPHRSLNEASDFFRGASFGALRKMRQHVDVFDAQVDVAGRQLQAHPAFAELRGRPDAQSIARQYIRAQFCGRWPGGQPMQPADGWFEPAAPLPAGGPARDLQEWRRCPVRLADAPDRACPAYGSHVRRMNPRDDGVVPPRRRVLLRRGLPYGRRGEADVGLIGLFFCASLEDQFEHLLGAWAQQNPMGPDNAGTARDPLIGQHADATAPLEIWLPDGSRMSATFDRPSVTTRGTLYLLYPARRGLERICGGAR